jgi:hypothetical protein
MHLRASLMVSTQNRLVTRMVGGGSGPTENLLAIYTTPPASAI